MEFIPILILVFVLLVAVAPLVIWGQVRFSKYVAIRDRKKEVTLLGGMIKLILWEPNEGLVLLRNKAISEVIYNSPGGTKFIYPIRGEELRARIPLALHLLTWEDEKILTRESIQVRMKVALWWRVLDLKAYVFSIDRNVHVENAHAEMGLLEAAEVWLKTLTESTLRTIVSQLSVAFLVSSKATSYLHVEQSHNKELVSTLSPEVLTSESMADNLHRSLTPKVSEYGIELQRVEIQEIALSSEIQQAIDKVWKASLLPAQTEQEARARKIELQAVASVLGVEATALNELMQNFQGSNFYGFPQFLENLFAKVASGSTRALPKSKGAAQLPSAKKQSE